mmetsp:Transcript_1907/g.4738  ORF Transcript_1907/g.4738 Transcript_1907/m.4738 type:complete len:412 (-) Transcript_1907:1781-3016(-)
MPVVVVIPVAGGHHLIAHQHHRHTVGDQEGDHHVLHLLLAHEIDALVLGFSLSAAVPGEVVVAAVAALLTVGVVVLAVVGDQVVQREAVMAHHKVDTMVGLAVVGVVQVRGARQPGRKQLLHAAVTLHKAAHDVAVRAVPLRPHIPVGERPDLVHSDVPRLGDQLHLAEHGVLGDLADEGGRGDGVAQVVAAQARGEVEAEAVHVVLLHPLHQAVDDHLGRHRMVGVDGVAAARVVQQLDVRLLVELVVDRVVDAAKGDEVGVIIAALGCVIVHDIQNDLNAGLVQRLDHLLELARSGHRATSICGKATHGRKKVHVGVSPDVDHVVPRVGASLKLQLVVLKHGQQLQRVDTQLLQEGDLPADQGQPCQGGAGQFVSKPLCGLHGLHNQGMCIFKQETTTVPLNRIRGTGE